MNGRVMTKMKAKMRQVSCVPNQRCVPNHRTGGEGAVKIVLANSQQPITQEEADSIHYIRNREQWRRHKQGIQGRTDKLLQSKIRRLQQSHGLPAHAKDSKL